MSLPAGSPRALFAWILGTATMGGRSVKTGITGTPAMTGVVGFTGAGWLSHKGFCGWGNQDHRSCCCCSLAVAMDGTAVGRLGSCSRPPKCYWALWAVGSAATVAVEGSRVVWGARTLGTTSAAFLDPPPLCVPVHPSVDVQMLGILQHPGVLGKGTFTQGVGLLTFCRL